MPQEITTLKFVRHNFVLRVFEVLSERGYYRELGGTGIQEGADIWWDEMVAESGLEYWPHYSVVAPCECPRHQGAPVLHEVR